VWVLLSGALMHAILMASLLLVERGALSRDGALVVHVLNGLVPLAIGLWVGRPRPGPAR